jgi:hypothetical protein
MLTKRQHDQQEAIWELLNTELHYIKALRVIVDVSLQNKSGETLTNYTINFPMCIVIKILFDTYYFQLGHDKKNS